MKGIQILYHGTTNDSAKKILEEKRFKKSTGDRHWLGDGVYFYEDMILAYRWLWIVYNGAFGTLPDSKEKLETECSIIKASVHFKNNRKNVDTNSRLRNDIEEQICVKNISCIRFIDKTDSIKYKGYYKIVKREYYSGL